MILAPLIRKQCPDGSIHNESTLKLGSWVFPVGLSAEMDGNHTVYDPNYSTTAKQVEGAHWNMINGGGSFASGEVYLDTITIGGTIVANHSIELAQQISEDFVANFKLDGILGLRFDAIHNI